MAKDHIRDYDLTAGNNTDVDGVSIAEGTAPSNINDAIREVMSHQAELHGDTRGGLVSGGSQGAYTLTTNETLAAYAQSGGLFVFEANHAMPSTATASLDIDGVGAKPIRKNVSVVPAANDIKANQIVIMAYEGATDVFHLITPAATSDGLPSATAMVFYQDAAPTGWTIAAAVDEHSIRLTKGSVAGGQAGGAAGGTSNFSTVFGLQATDSYTLLEADIPGHTHTGPSHTHGAGTLVVPTLLTGGGSNPAIEGRAQGVEGTEPVQGSTAASGTGATGSKGGDGGHAHAIELRVKWAACIVCTKD
jgi:hypothetical protein